MKKRYPKTRRAILEATQCCWLRFEPTVGHPDSTDISPDDDAFRHELAEAWSCWLRFRRTPSHRTEVFASPHDNPNAPTYDYSGPFDITIRQERGGDAIVTHLLLRDPHDTGQKGDAPTKKIGSDALLAALDTSESCWFHFRRTAGGPTKAFISPHDDPDAPTYEYTAAFDATIRQERGGKTTVTDFLLHDPGDNEQKGDPS